MPARPIVVLLRGHVEVGRWPLPTDPADLVWIDELARAQVDARRLGCRLQLMGVDVRRAELLELVGLRQLFAVPEPSVEVVGQAEEGEQAGVEEAVVGDDAVAGDLDHL